jgi:hypothetical protein
MNKHIFKKYKTLGKYYELTVPVSTYKSAIFFQKYKTAIDFESVMYGQIRHDREMLGGDYKIHKITYDDRKRKT